ncbi:MAG: hypothetical protein R2873_24330 [Caldilineaceae bacterium]
MTSMASPRYHLPIQRSSAEKGNRIHERLHSRSQGKGQHTFGVAERGAGGDLHRRRQNQRRPSTRCLRPGHCCLIISQSAAAPPVM